MKSFMPEVRVDAGAQQLDRHGDPIFPAAFYEGDLELMSVAWHWHDELELTVVHKGSMTVGAGSAAVEIFEGEGCFINTGVLHSLWK